jgi:hypothetical protein
MPESENPREKFRARLAKLTQKPAQNPGTKRAPKSSFVSEKLEADFERLKGLAKVLKPCDCTHDSEVPRCSHIERRIKARAERSHLLEKDQVYLCFVCADELKAGYTDLSNWTNGICDGCGHLQARECAIPVPED